MGFLAALAPVIGGALSSFGGSGKQGKTVQDMISEMQQQQMQRGSFANQFDTKQDQTTTNQFDPYMQAFRNTFAGAGLKEMQSANQPLYGDTQLAGIIGQQNDLSKAATESLRSSLARSGRLGSGAADQGVSDIETARFGNIANFQTQLPLLNEEVRQRRLAGGASMALPYVGLGYNTGTTSTGATSGSQTGTSESQANTTGKTTQQGTVQEYGPGFWKNFASNMSGLIGRGWPFSGPGEVLAPWQPGQGSSPSGEPMGYNTQSFRTPINPYTRRGWS